MQSNNILSYFIKDIKDETELALYKQINYYWSRSVQILYKDIPIFELYTGAIYNHIHNIEKHCSKKYIRKSNIAYDYINNTKALYYKNNIKIYHYNSNYIKFSFLYNTYLTKKSIYYVINNETVLRIFIIYYKKYKYIINYNRCIDPKFTSPQILIPNKYELDYYCKFFNI